MQSAIHSNPSEPGKEPSGVARKESALGGGTAARVLPYVLIALAMLAYVLITWR